MDVCRLHGVTENVYSEGTHLRVRIFRPLRVLVDARSLALDPMVRDAYHVRHSSETEKYRKLDRHKRFGTHLIGILVRVSDEL